MAEPENNTSDGGKQPTSNNTIGTKIQEYRLDNNWTRKDVVEKLGGGISEATLRRWEESETHPKSIDIQKLCNLFKCSPNDLIIGDYQTTSGKIEWQISDPQPFNQIPEHMQSEYYRSVEQYKELFLKVINDNTSLDELLKSNSEYSKSGKDALVDRLNLALTSGVVKITGVEEDRKLASTLRLVLPELSYCFVADVDPNLSTVVAVEAVAFLAVEKLISDIVEVKKVALSGGTTIGRFLSLIPPALPALSGVQWIPLLNPERSHQRTNTTFSANRVAINISHNQPQSISEYLHYLEPGERDDTVDAQEYVKEAREVLRTAKSANLAIISLGTSYYNYEKTPSKFGEHALLKLYAQLSEQQRKDCIGDILLTLVDKNCQPLGEPDIRKANQRLTYSIGIEGLKNIVRRQGRVWVLAARPKKANILYAAVKNEVVNCLVIDKATAQAIIDHAKESQNSKK